MSEFVALKYIEEYDIETIKDAVRSSFLELNANKKLKPDMKVLIKLNLPNAFSPDLALTTNPAVVSAVVDVLNEFGIHCILADSPYKKYTSNFLDHVYFETGMLEMANNSKCELNHNLRTYECIIPNGLRAKSLLMLDLINEVDAIINIGKVKIDENLGYLGAISNLFGLLPGEYKTLILNRLNNLRDFNHLLIDIAEAISEKLMINILDGIVAREAGNSQRLLSCLAISDNVYKLDACMLKILSLPYGTTILKCAEERGHINLNYPFKTIGENLEKFAVEDFALFDFNLDTPINSNLRKRKRYFKLHQRHISINPNRCKGCSVCSKICPSGAIMMKYDKNGELFANVDYGKCIFCFKCTSACPYKTVDIKIPLCYKSLIKNIEKQNQDIEENKKEKN